jgi:hypothetical protein
MKSELMESEAIRSPSDTRKTDGTKERKTDGTKGRKARSPSDARKSDAMKSDAMKSDAMKTE